MDFVGLRICFSGRMHGEQVLGPGFSPQLKITKTKSAKAKMARIDFVKCAHRPLILVRYLIY